MIRTSIIPVRPTFIGKPGELDLKAICTFVCLGFFLDEDTYFKTQKVLKPGHEFKVSNDSVVDTKSWFNWHYEPRSMSLKQATEEFGVLFESIVRENVGENKVILPVSGGLDSRSLAVALRDQPEWVHAYSYAFAGGHNETRYAKEIADVCGFEFTGWTVQKGYLWNVIEKLSDLNKCYSEFTHQRQMAFYDQYATLGDIFLLGHWGDVLFDDMGVPEDLSFEEQVSSVIKKIVKQGGMELASSLWLAWGLEGNFKDYLYERIRLLMAAIDIPNSANARIRAFKSLYWAPRWTAVNLSVFESVRPMALPYFDDRMCQFICSIPEKWLAGRQIQIEYIKQQSSKLARIEWQAHRPFNLYTYRMNRIPLNLPYRVIQKFKRLLSRNPVTERNWELQFLGHENDVQLRKHLFDNKDFSEWIPAEIANHTYEQFKKHDAVHYSHPVSMLLTLSSFVQRGIA